MSEAATYCANHPDIETSLRCNNCGKYICPKCAVRTPTGYRCRECVRGHQKVFETAQPLDYLVGFGLSLVLSAIGGLLVSRLGFFTILLAPAAGGIIAEAARQATGRRRSARLFQVVVIGVVGGGGAAGRGLIALSGEPGAGKPILVDAVEALLGVRADINLIRSGQERASVEGTFKIPEPIKASVHAILQREDLLDDANYLNMQREFRRDGRNVARVDGGPATLALVKELGELLIDLHGQSEHLSLLRVPAHRGLLDRYAGIEAQLSAYQATYAQLMDLRRDLTSLQAAELDAG